MKLCLLFFLFSCTTLVDYETSKARLLAKNIDFASVAEAHSSLPCQEMMPSLDLKLFEFGPWDKVVEFKETRSYVKKICFPKARQELMVRGKRYGLGSDRDYYAVPAFFGFQKSRLIEGLYKMEIDKTQGDLVFEMITEEAFDSMILIVDTLYSDFPIGQSDLYKFPQGKITVDLRYHNED